MCDRFAAQLPPELIARLFRTSGDLPNLAPNWNVAPTQPALVVRRSPDGPERHLEVLTWGLVPYFTKDLKKAPRPINARAESVASSAMFRAAFARRRCLVPADAWYEWRAETGAKQPYAMARRDGAPLAFAALWETWRDKSGDILRSFTILTTKANADIAMIHDRMPLIIEEEDWRAWLGEVPRNPADLLHPSEPGLIRLWPVSQAVNIATNNTPALLDRAVSPQPLPQEKAS
jgi:putative SOS response-associated peptidase YedK